MANLNPKTVSTLLVSSLLLAMLFTNRLVAEEAPALVKDPTRPGQYSAPVAFAAQPAASFQVASIIKRKKGAQAIINGQTASLGSFVDGAKVLRITPTRVLLQIDQKTMWVSVTDQSGMKVHRR